MGYERLLTPEMITAFAVFFGALFGGVVAVIAELRKPPDIKALAEENERAAGRTPEDLLTCLQEETDHVNRTLWVVEKKLSEHLHRIEKAILAGGRPQ
jgi:hypothetical protein